MILELSVVQGKPAGKTLAFPPGEYYLGRGAECYVRFDSEWVSRQHCQIRVTDVASTLRDLGSTNGTLLNGRLVVGELVLKTGDQIQIGPVLFHVQFRKSTTTGMERSSLAQSTEAEARKTEPFLDSTAFFTPPEPPPAE